ncbi:NTP transferase domain-containing protein [Desulfoplanes formicivorans]|uniref:MobA-like NTP transferase domain-containing protein n=1 Tax=Desulfoplanes formicivorans TaxID=1592317 RepID=A0A194AH24_9BACT|nr:phosphocholine cytidylyltransferase family protein [Desulfoplanes formicivorans]GAU09382.1 hypothetical protein DPF_2108 [Desulfoplanes formicivorans]
MKAIILAAGRGSRLLSLTDDRPKCLVELGGKPLLHWQIEALKGAGIDDILVVRGYCKEQLVGNFETAENLRWNETNMVTSLMAAREWLQTEPCIVSYSDIIYPSDAVKTLVEFESERLSILYDPNWLSLWKKRFSDPLSDAESFVAHDGVLTDIGRTNVKLSEIKGQYMGLLKFTPDASSSVFDLLDKDQKFSDTLDMTTLLRLLIEKGKIVMAVPWQGTWCEVDSQEDLKVAEALFREEDL